MLYLQAEKRSLYFDMRDDDEDNMDNWDEDKLKEVVEKKHGEGNKQRPSTDIVSKDSFLILLSFTTIYTYMLFLYT